MSPTWVSPGKVSHWCEWCGRRCGRYHESVVVVPLVHRATGVEETWKLCPPCALVPDATTLKLWRAWRRDGGSATRVGKGPHEVSETGDELAERRRQRSG